MIHPSRRAARPGRLSRCARPARRGWLQVVLAAAHGAALATGGTVTVLLPSGRRLVLERRPPAPPGGA